MQGASPLASPALDRLRHLQTLPKRHPVGWLAFFAACCPCLWLALLLPSPDPRSQSALPGGKGETKSLFRRGLRPRHPCTEPLAARTVPVVLVPGGIPCREPLPVGFAANYGFSSGDARGEAPCIRKLKVSPFPPGRGLGGWGRPRQLTAGAAGDQKGKPPCKFRNGTVSRRPVGQAPASDTATAGRAGNEKTPPLTPKETRFTLDRLPAFMYNYNEKGGSMARIPPPDTRFEQFVKIRICIDNHVTVCYNSDTA